MHLPDGVLPVRMAVPLAATSAAVIAAATARIRGIERREHVARAGALAAVVLVIQAVNFPIVGGASAHLLGTTLLAVVAGPAMALLAMLSVLVVQAFLLSDGGVVSLGANYLTLAAVPVLASLAIVGVSHGPSSPTRLAWRSALAAWVGTVASAALCAIYLAGAGVVGLRRGAPWLIGTAAFTGIAEALFTAVAVHTFVSRGVRVAGSHDRAPESPARGRWLVPILVLAVLFATALPFASTRLDTLQSMLRRAL